MENQCLQSLLISWIDLDLAKFDISKDLLQKIIKYQMILVR